jgi:hypothetical protein
MAKPGSRSARQIAHGGASEVDIHGLQRLAILAQEANAELTQAQAEHNTNAMDATSKAVAARAKTEEWITQFPAEPAKVRRQLGITPVPVNGNRKRGHKSGYFQLPLRDGTVGYFQRRTDDCFQVAIASCVQISPHRVPDLRIDEQRMVDMEPEEIERRNVDQMSQWMEHNGVTIMVHPVLPSTGKRWIGVVKQAYDSTADHCLLMSGRDCLFDPANLVPPGKDEPASTYGYADIDYGITIERS